MKIAAVFLSCIVGSAAAAWAAEPARAIVEIAQAGRLDLLPPADAPPPSTSAKPAPVAPAPVAPAPVATPAQAAPAGAAPEAAKRDEKPHQPLEAARRPEPPRRVCFNSAETREKIAAHRLAEPFKALRVGRQQGEALRARLCSWKTDKFVYEVFVLRRDGRIIHVYMNAANGQAVGALSDSDLK